MAFIEICAKNEQYRNEIIQWMCERIVKKGHLSLINLIEHYETKLIIKDDDVFSYWDVGWNINDLGILLDSNKHPGTKILSPKIRYAPTYI